MGIPEHSSTLGGSGDEKTISHSSILFLGLVLTVIAFLGTAGTVCANTLSSQDNVVRIQGSNSREGGTGFLVGMAEYGTTLRMVFLGADHTLEREGPIRTIGFGNLGSSNALNLNASRATIYTGGLGGTEDLAIYGITVDLNSLTPTQRSFLTGLIRHSAWPLPHRRPLCRSV